MERLLFYHRHRVLVVVVLLVLAQPRRCSPRSGFVGICVGGRNMRTITRPEVVNEDLRLLKVPRARLLDPDASLMAVLTGASFNPCIADEDAIVSLAANVSNAHKWVRTMLGATAPGVNISTVTIGTGVVTRKPAEFVDTLLEALNNMRHALDRNGFSGVPVTTSHAYDLVNGLFPPSAAKFDDNTLPQMIRLLDFLNRTNAPFQMEMYPILVYAKATVPRLGLDYALFQVDPHDESVMIDPATRLRYTSILEMMMDSAVFALDKTGFGHLQLEISGTGWPLKYRNRRYGSANPLTYCEYANRVVSLFQAGAGTPLRPYQRTVVYINGMFDDEGYDGETPLASSFLSNMGLLDTSFRMRCDISFGPLTSDDVTVPTEEITFPGIINATR